MGPRIRMTRVTWISSDRPCPGGGCYLPQDIVVPGVLAAVQLSRSSERSRPLRLRTISMAVLSIVVLLSLVAPPASAVTKLRLYPVATAFAAPGPFATKSTTISVGSSTYVVFRPSSYRSLGFKSPIVTWGNGTDATPGMYTTLLTHFASYGFTVIASSLTNTGSGREIAARRPLPGESGLQSGQRVCRPPGRPRGGRRRALPGSHRSRAGGYGESPAGYVGDDILTTQ